MASFWEEIRTQTQQMKNTAKTEQEMRDAKVPHAFTAEELAEYIESLRAMEHDYGTCVYAMSMAATAAFNYIAHQLGVTGFQASCADLDVIRRTRHMDGPFMMVNINDTLYPQYDVVARVQEYIDKCAKWRKEQATKLLAERSEDAVHPDVWAHWKKLSELEIKEEKE